MRKRRVSWDECVNEDKLASQKISRSTLVVPKLSLNRLTTERDVLGKRIQGTFSKKLRIHVSSRYFHEYICPTDFICMLSPFPSGANKWAAYIMKDVWFCKTSSDWLWYKSSIVSVRVSYKCVLKLTAV
jgi:hypothetical protein